MKFAAALLAVGLESEVAFKLVKIKGKVGALAEKIIGIRDAVDPMATSGNILNAGIMNSAPEFQKNPRLLVAPKSNTTTTTTTISEALA